MVHFMICSRKMEWKLMLRQVLSVHTWITMQRSSQSVQRGALYTCALGRALASERSGMHDLRACLCRCALRPHDLGCVRSSALHARTCSWFFHTHAWFCCTSAWFYCMPSFAEKVLCMEFSACGHFRMYGFNRKWYVIFCIECLFYNVEECMLGLRLLLQWSWFLFYDRIKAELGLTMFFSWEQLSTDDYVTANLRLKRVFLLISDNAVSLLWDNNTSYFYRRWRLVIINGNNAYIFQLTPCEFQVRRTRWKVFFISLLVEVNDQCLNHWSNQFCIRLCHHILFYQKRGSQTQSGASEHMMHNTPQYRVRKQP